ncbi:hypothetical protein H106_02144 [Trichophyton rubrum CBS 735.88]|nr:hypothetical protein H106_02144 [Trichophyton rubrum CBS 735.88]
MQKRKQNTVTNCTRTPQQIAQLRNQQAQMMHHQMQREHSDMEMNGHRPQSPSSVENAPSPSKRQRIDGPQVNGAQMTPNGRAQPQGMPGQQNQQQANSLLMQHGINPRNLTAAQLQSFQSQNPSVQAKSIQVYNQNLIHHTRSAMNNQGIPNGLINPGVMPNQPDMMQPMHDNQGMMPQDYYSNGQMAAQMRQGGMPTPGAQNGNHALQDYQMQLMLLEQQNKKRLLIARQEQDSMARDGQPQPGPAQPGQPGAGQQQQQQQPGQGMHNSLPPGTSPQGSRAGASPNPSEQMKRGTPKMPQTGLPGSPNVGDAMQTGRGSPASMNFGNQIPQDMGGAAFFNTMKNMQEAGGVVGPNGMRPPSSNPAYSGAQMTQPMDAMARQQQAQAQAQAQAGARMPSGNWQQPQPPQSQPMIPPQQQQQPQQQGQPGQPVGTPQERNAMPPPQAPPVATAPNNGRQSPQPGSAAPPTPQQSSKPAPKKKDTKDNNRKRPAKRVPTTNAPSAAATASESEPPPTPTPSTPITPVHPSSFNKAAPANNAQPTSAPATQPQAVGQPPPPPQPPQQQQQQQPQQQQQQQQQQMLSMQPAQGQPPAAAQPGQAQGQVDPSQPFGDMSLTDNQSFNLDFSSLDNPDILENFDFDTFLNTDDQSAFNFDPNTPYLDGVEAGTGERM